MDDFFSHFLKVKLIILQKLKQKMFFFSKYRLLLENEHLNSIFIREKWVGHQARYDFYKTFIVPIRQVQKYK